jgi:hypothetical protein
MSLLISIYISQFTERIRLVNGEEKLRKTACKIDLSHKVKLFFEENKKREKRGEKDKESLNLQTVSVPQNAPRHRRSG